MSTSRRPLASRPDADSLFWPFCREVISRTGARFWGAVGLMVLTGVASGATIVLLIPLARAIEAGTPDESSAPLFRAVLSLTDSSPGLAFVLVLLVAAVAAQGLLRWLDVRVQAGIAQDLMLALREQLFGRIVHVEWIEFSRRRTADLLEALTRQIDRVGYAVHDLLGLCAAIVTASVYVALGLAVSAPVTILVLGLGGLLTLALARRRRRANATGHALTEADRQMHRAIDAALAGMKLTRTHGVESRQIAELEAVARPLKRVHLALAGNPAAVRMWFDAGAALILSIAAYVGLRGVALTPTELVVLLVVFVRLAPHLSTVQVYYQTLSAELPAFAAVAALDRELAASAETGSDDATGDTEWQSGALRLDDVSFTYDRDPVLAGVSLDVPRGHTVAIVGASGAGKTTIADLVLGLLSPSDGRVLVDGRPLTDERRAGWQRQVGYVPQDAFLFHDTIRRNLLWAAPGADDAALRDALQAAAADFVWALPDQVDTVVGDRGVLLSTGERQRLALARALLRRPRLLVLDEATSALDSENERAIQRAVRGLHGQVTILVIAHRLSTVRDVDQLYVLDAGRVAESGTWAELMARPAGRLRALARAQAMTPDDDTIGATPQRSEQHG